jgi:multicomponent Na+:H+ antiporter subunit C
VTLYLLLGAALFAVGLFALIAQPNLLRKILALNVMGGAAFLWLAATAARSREPYPDPVPHAMVLTGIVVAVSATAFALALVRHLHAETGRAEMLDPGVMDGDEADESDTPKRDDTPGTEPPGA